MNLKEEDIERKGLQSEHLYSILDICQIGGLRLLQLRDPIGNFCLVILILDNNRNSRAS